jgi:arsenate reductase (thioredoxin)
VIREEHSDSQTQGSFFSTGDSTRSQIAKGFLDASAGDKLTAVSTAEQTPDRDPLTVEIMREVGIDISQQHAEDLAQSLKEHFAYVSYGV